MRGFPFDPPFSFSSIFPIRRAMAKVSFFSASLAVWVLLSMLSVVIYRPRIEKDLTARSMLALERGGVDGTVVFTGRDAIVEIPQELSAAARKAFRLVDNVFGVRTAIVRIGKPIHRSPLEAPPAVPPAVEIPAHVYPPPPALPMEKPIERKTAEPHAQTVAPEAMPEVGIEMPAAKQLSVALAELHLRFIFDSTKLVEPSMSQLGKVCALLNQYQKQRVRVVGYTDATGKPKYNLRLSQRRAKAVVDYLSAQGIPTERLHSAGRGASAFIASNETKEGRQTNRRVEFEVVDESEGMG
jgi:outer membrane protein OmpA-like peptidoglycan-associated protein